MELIFQIKINKKIYFIMSGDNMYILRREQSREREEEQGEGRGSVH